MSLKYLLDGPIYHMSVNAYKFSPVLKKEKHGFISDIRHFVEHVPSNHILMIVCDYLTMP